MTLCTRYIGRATFLLALALALFPPGPTRSLALAQGPNEPPAPFHLFLPLLGNSPAAPDLIFTPDSVQLTPGTEASVTVQVEPQANLTGASFELPGVQDGVSSRFEAAPDGQSGTLTIEASGAAEAGERALMVQGRSGDGTKSWVGKLTVTTDPVLGGRAFFINSFEGNDANDGSQAKPFKTLTKGLSISKSGDTLNLAGNFGQGVNGSGESIPATGLLVPNGVTIIGGLDAGFPNVNLLGKGDGVGLRFAGDAVVKNVIFAAAGFGVSMFANQGTQTLSNITFGVAKGSGVIDGVPLLVGLLVRGTAQTTLTSVANTFGSNIGVPNGTGIGVADQAQFTMSGVTTTVTGLGIGVDIVGQAKFTMDSGLITGGNPNCNTSTRGIRIANSAQAMMKNAAIVQNIAGVGLDVSNGAKATIDHSAIVNSPPDGCAPAARILLTGSSSLLMRNNAALIDSRFGVNSVGIDAGRANFDSSTGVKLTIDHSSVGGFSKRGLDLTAKGTFVMNGGDVGAGSGGIAIEAGKDFPVMISNASVHAGGNSGIGLRAFFLKLRNSDLTSSGVAVMVPSAVSEGAGIFHPKVDLGTIADPGNNILGDPSIHIGVTFQNKGFDMGSIDAVGNTWLPNTQGADANGHYTIHRTISGVNPERSGRNFDLLGVDEKINL